MSAATLKPKSKVLDFALPTRGVYRGADWHDVPTGFAPDALNVFPYDALGKLRPGKRGGTSKYWSFRFASRATFIQHMSVANVTDTTAGANQNYVIIVCDGKTYAQLPGDVSPNPLDGGTAAFSPGRKVSGFTQGNATYLTDGLAKKVYDWTAANWGDWTASAGTFPQDASSTYPRVWTSWRGRAIGVRLDKGSPSIVFGSKIGDPTNFDVGATPSPDMAFDTTTNFKAGQFGDGGSALMSVNNDVLYIGCDNSIQKFIGDPADGGTLAPEAYSVGVLSDTAWCSVESTIYFLGTSGIYKMDSGGPPVCLSEFAVNDDYKSLPHKSSYLSMAYDKKRDGLLIFATKADTPWTTTHCFYDLRAQKQNGVGGFFPLRFPLDTGGEDNAGGTLAPTHGPTKCLTYDGIDETADSRVVLLGCRDGYVRVIDDAAFSDDSGQAITSYFYAGPIQAAGPADDFMMNGWYPVLGEQAASVAVTWALQGGPDPYAAFASPTISRTGSFIAGGRQSPRGERMTQNALWLKCSDATIGKTHSLERASVRVEMGGPNR